LDSETLQASLPLRFYNPTLTASLAEQPFGFTPKNIANSIFRPEFSKLKTLDIWHLPKINIKAVSLS